MGYRKVSKCVYFSAHLDVATCNVGKGKIYCIVPTGLYEDDPNVTDKKFPADSIQCYLKILYEVTER